MSLRCCFGEPKKTAGVPRTGPISGFPLATLFLAGTGFGTWPGGQLLIPPTVFTGAFCRSGLVGAGGSRGGGLAVAVRFTQTTVRSELPLGACAAAAPIAEIEAIAAAASSMRRG